MILKRISYVLLISILSCSVRVLGQDSLVTKAIAASVQLDSVVIVATRHGFDVEDFIRLIQTDESLYMAFKNLRRSTNYFETSMEFTDKHGQVKATYQSKNNQTFDGRCRSMEVLSENSNGDFYKGRKKKHRYYTYTLYDHVFVTHGRECEGSNPAGTNSVQKDGGAIERHISELKTLIFRPGERSYVPFIGHKTEIFSEEMINRYDFAISSGEHHDKPTYIFTAKVNEYYVERENKTVFKELTTYFSKEDFQVVARTYRLSQNTAAFMFDVTMRVDLTKADTLYFPESVIYYGIWNIPTRKKESGTFTVHFSQFQ